jgi:transposase InsO family protein
VEIKLKMLLLGLDSFTKKVQAIPVANLKAGTVADAIEKILDELGTPAKVRFDRGREYVNATVSALLKRKKIDVVYSHPPRKSQFAERAIRTLKGSLFKVM